MVRVDTSVTVAMSSLNESRSNDNFRRPNFVAAVISHADASFQGNRTLGSVRSSPAAASPELRTQRQRPNFLSADHVYRATIFEANDTTQPTMNHQQARAGANENAGGQQSGGMSLYISQSLRQAIQESQNIVVAVAEIEKRKKPIKEDEDLFELNDSSVDDAKTFPVLPPISRRNSDRVDRSAHKGLSIRSLPDLRRIKSTFASIAAWEGVTDPEVVVHILKTHPNIDVIYMSPALHPEVADYSPYFMHMVSPGCVDVLNYCAVGRQYAIRYIRGKKPHRLTLKRWMFEQRVTVKLRQNNFFKNFRLIKAFNGLAQCMDMGKFGKTKRKLRSTLNACNPSFADTLLLVQTMCLDLEGLSMIQVDKELTYTLNEFMEDQEHYTREITSKIERYTSMLLHLTSRTCWDDVIGAGLAVEREERKHLAPKRINELRKMQRRKLNTSVGGQRQVLDESSIGEWRQAEGDQGKQIEALKEERCVRLLRFIYQIDCMLRHALYQIYVNSLGKTADYLTLQMKTFLTDAEIKALVRGYLGHLDINHSLLGNNDDDDGDGGDGGGAVGGLKGSHQGSGTQTNGRGAPSADPGKNGRDQQNPHKSQAAMENEISTATTTTGGTTFVSSSAPTNFTSGSQGQVSSSLRADNAIYIQFIHGELGRADSLESTTSSTLSEEEDNNAMGNEDMLLHFSDLDFSGQPRQLDNFNSLTVTGAEVRTYRLQNENNYEQLVNESAASSTDDLISENEEVTVVENSDRQGLAASQTSNWSSDGSGMATDLTITSDERDGHSKGTVNAYFVSHTLPNLRNGKFPGKTGKGLFQQKTVTLTPNREPDKKKLIKLNAFNTLNLGVVHNPTVDKPPALPSSPLSDTQSAKKDKVTNSAFCIQPHNRKEPNMMGLFGHLFSLLGESSVDLTEESNAEDILEFPILDGTTWDPQNVDHYLSVRSSLSSSVDDNGSSGIGSENQRPERTQNSQLTISDNSENTVASFKSTSDNCRNVTQNKMSYSSEVDAKEVKQTLQAPQAGTGPESLDVVSAPSTSRTSLVAPVQDNILEFLAREMEHPYTDNFLARRAISNISYQSPFLGETDDTYKDGVAPPKKLTLIIGEDQFFVSPVPPGMRKDGGKRRKKGKAADQAIGSVGVVQNGITWPHNAHPPGNKHQQVSESTTSSTLSRGLDAAWENLSHSQEDFLYTRMEKQLAGSQQSAKNELPRSKSDDLSVYSTPVGMKNDSSHSLMQDAEADLSSPIFKSVALFSRPEQSASSNTKPLGESNESGILSLDTRVRGIEAGKNNNWDDSARGGKGQLGCRRLRSDGVQDLKPMFHAAIHMDKELIGMTPDVYDFTGTAFNMIHDIEEHLLSIDTLTSNSAFLPFKIPSALPGTPVDKKPKGPSLELILRRDHQLVQVKNAIYGCIDSMFHSAGVYTAALQKLYNRYISPQVQLTQEMGSRDPAQFQESLQIVDTQLKIVESLPESQRLGMFLIDISPYKESLRVTLTARLQSVQQDVNQEAILRIQSLIRKLDNLLALLESHPSTLDALYVRLTTTDSLHDIISLLQSREIAQIANLYNVMDRFAVPYSEDERRVFESCHYMLTSIQRAGDFSRRERRSMIEGIDKCLERDVAWIQSQVKKVLKPVTENTLFLDGFANVIQVKQALTYAEEIVRSYVTKANFVREIQRYLGRPESHFRELFQVSSRYVNTRNLWLLMADWDTKLNNWKRQSFVTLDIQKINNYTFKYMEACNKLEKVLPKNTVVTVFGEKMDVMLRWLNFIIEFRGQAVKPRHWRQIQEALGVEFGDELPLTLASLMSINAIEKQKMLHVILNKARAEMNVQSEFDEVYHQCQELKLSIQVKQKVLLEGEEPVTVYFLGDTFEVEESLNYCVMELERIDLSPHSGFLHESLEQFIQRIFESLENIVAWAEMQMKLSRLRRLLLRHMDLVQSLPAEVRRYKEIFMEYSSFIEGLQQDPNVLKWCTSQEMHGLVEAHHNEIIQIYRVLKREIEQSTGPDNVVRDQPVFGF